MLTSVSKKPPKKMINRRSSQCVDKKVASSIFWKCLAHVDFLRSLSTEVSTYVDFGRVSAVPNELKKKRRPIAFSAARHLVWELQKKNHLPPTQHYHFV